MNVLQLTSDWKWTGPAEPMLLLHRAMTSLGESSLLACPEAPEQQDAAGVADEARNAGLAPQLRIDGGRGVRWLRDLPDIRRLRRLVEDRDVAIVHAWHTRDHVLALRAAASRRRKGLTAVVRSWRSADAIAATPWNRWLFGPGCDALLCVSPKAAAVNARLRGERPLLGALGAVDVERFAKASEPSAQLRRELGLRDGAPVIGVVARVQRHRRFDLLLAAMQRLAQRHPTAQLMIVGRGTHFETLAREPVRSLGLEGRVVFAGHRREDYPQVLRSIDLLTFLVPGSDGSCRAVLEAAACGIPALVTRRGALPEIVVDGETGRVVEEDPDALALSWKALLDDEQERRRLGAGALWRAQKLFVPERLATELRGLYPQALARRGI